MQQAYSLRQVDLCNNAGTSLIVLIIPADEKQREVVAGEEIPTLSGENVKLNKLMLFAAPKLLKFMLAPAGFLFIAKPLGAGVVCRISSAASHLLFPLLSINTNQPQPHSWVVEANVHFPELGFF